MRERCSSSAMFFQPFVSGPGNVPTQQESDRQKTLERRRQQDRDKRARETPDERNRRRGLF